MQCWVVLYVQNRTQPHRVLKSWGKRVMVAIVAYVLALRAAARVSLLVLQWYLRAVALSQTEHRWEKANLIMKALDSN